MAPLIRAATPDDIDALSALLLDDATARQAADPRLWPLATAPREAIRSALSAAMQADAAPFRQQWLVAMHKGDCVGVAHSILLPVPPIYAGAFGPPGLIMEDCHVVPGAPPGTQEALLRAAEDDLRDAGARVLLASSVTGGNWEDAYGRAGYAPLTAYLAKTDLAEHATPGDVRAASESDLPGIDAASAQSRAILEQLHPRFWTPHDDAASRFAAWMRRSLTLPDRDMFTTPARGPLAGYLIAQPATRLHFPPAHDIAATVLIDDFHHADFADTARLATDGSNGGGALLHAGESARHARGDRAVMVVCPAAWESKLELLKRRGYRTTITWHIKVAV